MPPTTPREVLAQLVADVAALTDRVAALENADPDGWDDPFDAALPESETRAAEVADDGSVQGEPPNAEQIAQRGALLPRLGFENLPKEHGLTVQEAADAYLKGGPMWLHWFDRDFVLTLPQDVRGALVDDVLAGGYQQDAIELGRDILKDDGESRRGAEVSMEQQDRDWVNSHG